MKVFFLIQEENPLKGHVAKPRLKLASCCPPSAPSMACTDSPLGLHLLDFPPVALLLSAKP